MQNTPLKYVTPTDKSVRAGKEMKDEPSQEKRIQGVFAFHPFGDNALLQAFQND
jgi:hypothetical protein